MISLISFFFVVGPTFAAYCGTSTIPFSLELHSDGSFSLGCARPTCFGWDSTGHWATQDHTFLIENDRHDGYLRPAVIERPAFDASHVNPPTTSCYISKSCASDQWAGGLFRMRMGIPGALWCCSYHPLSQSSSLGIATVLRGQVVIGGEVEVDGRVQYFDYLRNIQEIHDSEGTVTGYSIEMARMPCVDPPALRDDSISSNSIAKARADPTSIAGSVAESALQAAEQANALTPADGLTSLNAPDTGVGANSISSYGPAPPSESYSGYALAPPSNNYQVAYPAPAPAYPQATGSCCPGTCCQSYYYPVSHWFCFAADSMVRMEDGTERRMDELKISDRVIVPAEETMNATISSVRSWLHRLPEQKAEFIVITPATGREIKLTPKHFIYKTNCLDMSDYQKVTADNVTVGDCVFTLNLANNLRPSRVIRVRKTEQNGIFAPLTDEGTMIVDNVAVSCHSEVENNVIVQTLHKNFVQCDVNDMKCSLKETGFSLALEIARLIIPSDK